MRIAFHTPLNAFADAGISGDRRMARQIATALRQLGHAVEPISDARAHLRLPEDLAGRRIEAQARRGALLPHWRHTDTAPELWFTYHSYYKAPDLLGPEIASQLNIPYVVAEASDSRRRAVGEWAEHVALARKSFAAADLHLWFTRQDRDSIAPWSGDSAFLALPPFIETVPAVATPGRQAAPPRLVTVAMMRAGAKLDSYHALAEVLARLTAEPWTLTIIGDGPVRSEVEAAFATIPAGRLRWLGALDHDAVTAELAAHDVFIWPGIGEAYGLVYLEAQAADLPVVAFDSGGVSATVRRNETALLAPEKDSAALAAALARLLTDGALRARMAQAAQSFVATERTLERAGEIIAQGLGLACTRHAERGKHAR